MLALLGKSNAESKVATYLLSISSRNARRKLSSVEFRLPMSRADLGSYLGLTVETVSRVFSRLQKEGVLSVSNKEIQIMDMDGLRSRSAVR